MIFSKYKFPAVIVFALIVGVPIFFNFGRDIYVKIFTFFIVEQSIIVLSLKLIIVAIVLQILSFITMRKLEVNS